MNLKIIMGLGLIISILLISGCSEEEIESLKEKYKPEIKQTVQEAVQEAMQNDSIVCNPPYMRFADGCCLDVNENSICDNDEEVEELKSRKFNCPNGDTFVTTDIDYIFNEEKDCPQEAIRGEMEVECPEGYYESFEECQYGEWFSGNLKDGIHCCGKKPECPDGLKECEDDICGQGRVYMGAITCCEVCG